MTTFQCWCPMKAPTLWVCSPHTNVFWQRCAAPVCQWLRCFQLWKSIGPFSWDLCQYFRWVIDTTRLLQSHWKTVEKVCMVFASCSKWQDRICAPLSFGLLSHLQKSLFCEWQLWPAVSQYLLLSNICTQTERSGLCCPGCSAPGFTHYFTHLTSQKLLLLVNQVVKISFLPAAFPLPSTLRYR